MGRTAKNVYTEPGDIRRIQGFVVALPGQARVRITTRDGGIHTGTVTERPAAQVFEDASGSTGMNGLLRIDSSGPLEASTYLWLGDIKRVERLIENESSRDVV